MPYLSRIWLNPLRKATQRLLRNPQAMHAAVLGGIPQQPVAERTLWRLEAPKPHRADLLVLTHGSPSWEHLVEKAGWPAADEPQAVVRPYGQLLDRLTVGQEFAFRLLANPVSAVRRPTSPSAQQQDRLSNGPRPRGVRVAHRTVAHQLTWFTDRVTGWGFAVPLTTTGDPQVQISHRERLVFTKTSPEANRRTRVVLQTVTYEGLLRVTDTEAARTSLLNGVGHARAYGCGLITLAPAPVVVDG